MAYFFVKNIRSIGKVILLICILPFIAVSASSCEKQDPSIAEVNFAPDDTLTVYKVIHQYNEWTAVDDINIYPYATMSFSHQSAAAYGDYAFFVSNGRSKICMYNLAKKELVHTIDLPEVNENLYHCNQSTFGFERYAPDDPFPLLYISQRNNSSERCFIEGYRIKTKEGEDSEEYQSFTIELVQTIYLPAMSYDNSLGNANCVIDASNKVMYTYSRNNRSEDDNYLICKISKFKIPSAHQAVVTFDDDDILDSFMLDCTAYNMQGGCIEEGILYIGQGIPSYGDLYFNVVDLEKKLLVKRFPLYKYNVGWEPEGCFFYDGCVMLAHTTGISRIEKK